MALKLFLTYIGLFFVGATAIFTIAKTLVLNFNVKKTLIYGLLSSSITSLVAFGTTFITEHPFALYWIFSALFFLFGCLHYWISHRRFFQTKKFSIKVNSGELLYSLSVILVTVVALSSMLYFFRDKQFMFFPILMSALLFFVPYFFSNMFRALYGIPHAHFTTWQYPSKPIDLPDESSDERLLVIGFEISKKPTDVKTYFRAKAPEKMILGDLYYHFLNDYNELQSETPIQYQTADAEMQEWWFRIKPKWYQRNKVLDPQMTFIENGIKENSVIICERLG